MLEQAANYSCPAQYLCFLVFVVFVVIFGLIVWEKLPRMYLALFGAVLMLVIGVFDPQEAISFVSWETIGFLLGMFLLIEILVESGFFRWIAFVSARALHYSPLKILIFFPALAFFLSAFINSITVMLFLAVITVELSRVLKFDPVPVIVSEVVLSNIGGAATLVGDPPNVILGTVLGFGFDNFIIHNGPVAFLSAIGAIGVSYLMNRRAFQAIPSMVKGNGVIDLNPQAQIKDKYLLVCGLVGMGGALFLLMSRPLLVAYHIPVFVSTASLLPAFAILTFGGKRVYRHHFMSRIDTETLMFFIGLFILIGALEKVSIIRMVAQLLSSLFKGEAGFVSSVFWGSGIISAFVDNVPLAMAMTYIIKQSVAHHIVSKPGILVWATSLGVDLGGNLTPIGASANVVAYSYLEKNHKRVGWLGWLRLAFPQGLAALAISYVCILIKLRLGYY
jgi:Na+/H+ antiporter NhaD/arsenite permease-like protein